MEAKDTVMSDVVIQERAKNIVGAGWGSVVENLTWLRDKQAEISFKAGIKAVGEWLDSQKEFLSYHYSKFALHNSELETLRQGKIPN